MCFAGYLRGYVGEVPGADVQQDVPLSAVGAVPRHLSRLRFHDLDSHCFLLQTALHPRHNARGRQKHGSRIVKAFAFDTLCAFPGEPSGTKTEFFGAALTFCAMTLERSSKLALF